jgi:hypothetical protein
MAEPRHRSTARTFRLGAVAEAHIAEIVERLTTKDDPAPTDTEAVRRALAHFAKSLRAKNKSTKSPG